jgi:hypothetical protein
MPALRSPDSERPPATPTTRAGRLARRWSNWAANLFVSGIVALVGLTFGREVIEAWRSAPRDSAETAHATTANNHAHGNADTNVATDDAPDDKTDASTNDGDNSGVAELWFNDLPLAVGHGNATGTLEDVLAKVVAVCERSAERAVTQRETWERPPGPAELRLLTQLDTATARQERVTPAGAFTVFERRRPVPLVAVVGTPILANAPPPAASSGEGDNTPEAKGDSERRRVLAWAVILPDAWYTELENAGARKSPDAAGSGSVPKGRWTWFTWRPQVDDRTATATSNRAASDHAASDHAASDHAASGHAASSPEIPGGRCVMRIVSVDGSERWAFSGTGSPDAWRAGFEQWFKTRGWRPLPVADVGTASAVGAWRRIGKSRWLGSFAADAVSQKNRGTHGTHGTYGTYGTDTTYGTHGTHTTYGSYGTDEAKATNATRTTEATHATRSLPSASSPSSTLSLRRADAHLIQEDSSALRALLIVYPKSSGE